MACGTHSGLGHVVAPLLRYIAIFMPPFFENIGEDYFNTTRGKALEDLLLQQASRDRGGDKEVDKY
jgi:hypothetical protein